MASLKLTLDKADRELVTAVQRMHVGAQVYRFLRIALFAFVASLPISTSHLGWSALGALATGSLEVAFRQFYPAFPLDKTTSAVTQAVKEQAMQLATAAINERVENYKDGLANQAAVAAMLAPAKTTGQTAGQAAQPPTPVPDAKPPAVPSS